MRGHVARCAPLEACGLLAGKVDQVQAVLRMENAANSRVRFRMVPEKQWQAFCWIEAQGLDLVGIYHSHPAGPPEPSPTDIEQATYPVVHVIWAPQGGRWQARGYTISGQGVSEVRLHRVNIE
jgi:proteasome lid subunit RPN8/RPN11